LVFGLVTLFSIRGIKVKSIVLKEDFIYLFLLLLPVIFGLNGHYSRLEGILLIIFGIFFFFTLSFDRARSKTKPKDFNSGIFYKNLFLLIISMGILIISAYFTVKFAQLLASDLGIPSFLIGLTVVSIGSCLPELIFSIKAVRKNHDGLALGDVLGTVITDATIILGIIILIKPFSFNPILCYITGFAMFLSGLIAIIFMKTGKILSKREGIILLIIYALFLILSFKFEAGF